MSQQFAAPTTGSGDAISWEDEAGRLVMITPKSIEAGMVTEHGTVDAVRAAVVVLDAPGGAVDYPDAILFPTALRSRASRWLTDGETLPILGRVSKVTFKNGRSGWNLADFDDADVKLASDYLARKPKFAAPASAPAEPAQAAVTAPAAPAPQDDAAAVVATLVGKLRAAGLGDDQITKSLVAKGHDPADVALAL